MEVLLGGVGDAFAVESHGTHFLVRHDDFTLLIDCPDAFRRALKENAFPDGDGVLDESGIDAVYITHLHGDHVNGLEMLLAYRAMVLKEQTPVYTTPFAAPSLWEHRLAVSLGQVWDGKEHHEMGLNDFAKVKIVVWEVPTAIGPFEITTRETLHHIPTSALRIRVGDTVLAYSCDTAWDPDLIAWLFEDADLVLHESSHGPAHTPIHHLAELSEEQRARLIVVHYPDQMDPADYPGLRFGKQGEILQVGA